MKKILTFAAGLLACAGLMLTASPALARSDVSVGINLGIPGFYPAPVYVEPRPVYVEPRRVYVEPRPVYVQPRVIYTQPSYYQEPRWEDRGYRGRHWKDKEHRGRHWRDRDRGDRRHGRGHDD